MDDVRLMLDFKAGNEDAFATLVSHHQVGLYNFFYRLEGNVQAAEDLTQDVLLKLYKHAHSYTPEAKFTTYLYRIARNCWLDAVRKRSRRGHVISLDRAQADAGKHALKEVLPGNEKPAEETYRQREIGAAIEEAVAELPEEQRLVFVLSEVQGMRYSDIAEALEIPQGTVKSRMHHAVMKLRERLAHLCD